MSKRISPIRFCVPTTWTDNFLNDIIALNQRFVGKAMVYEIYGALPTGIVGSARPPSKIPAASKEQVERHILRANAQGLRVNYLLNTPCMGGAEYDPNVVNQTLDILKWFSKIGVRAVTVSIPYIAQIVKRYYPNLELCLSAVCQIDSIRKLTILEDIGIDRVTLDYSINRNFGLLRKMHQRSTFQLSVLANDPCLLDCPQRQYHYSLAGHASQCLPDAGRLQGYFDYPKLKCWIHILSNPEEIVKSPWIRPEDVPYYIDTGIDLIKLSGRTRPTDWILWCIETYMAGKLEGNLCDLIGFRSNFRFPAEDLPRIQRPPDPLRIFVNNKDLHGFLEHFKDREQPCDCTQCSYCNEIASKVIEMDEPSREKHIQFYKRLLDEMLNRATLEEDVCQHRHS